MSCYFYFLDEEGEKWNYFSGSHNGNLNSGLPEPKYPLLPQKEKIVPWVSLSSTVSFQGWLVKEAGEAKGNLQGWCRCSLTLVATKFCPVRFLEGSPNEWTYTWSRLTTWRLQPSELIRAHGPSAVREHVPTLSSCLMIQELVSADQRRLQSSYIENSAARCRNNLPLRASKFSQLMGLKLLQAKSPLVSLLNCFTPLILDWASITLLCKLGTSGTGFHWHACKQRGQLSRHQNRFSQVFSSQAHPLFLKLPGTLPSASPSCACGDLVSCWAVQLPGLNEKTPSLNVTGLILI